MVHQCSSTSLVFVLKCRPAPSPPTQTSSSQLEEDWRLLSSPPCRRGWSGGQPHYFLHCRWTGGGGGLPTKPCPNPNSSATPKATSWETLFWSIRLQQEEGPEWRRYSDLWWCGVIKTSRRCSSPLWLQMASSVFDLKISTELFQPAQHFQHV